MTLLEALETTSRTKVHIENSIPGVVHFLIVYIRYMFIGQFFKQNPNLALLEALEAISRTRSPSITAYSWSRTRSSSLFTNINYFLCYSMNIFFSTWTLVLVVAFSGFNSAKFRFALKN